MSSSSNASTPRSAKPLALLLPLLAALVVLVAFAPSASAGRASADQATAGESADATAAARTLAPRKGGRVRRAWPQRGRAPRDRLTRWLARQVGAKKAVKRRRGKAAAASGPLATSAATPTNERLVFGSPQGNAKLRLVRSFEIPTDDPSYARLLGLSFTYDSAIAAAAFIGTGSRTLAEQLLDQLAALQRTDGSIEFAFDTSTGAGSSQFRSGAVAWVALAAAYYKREYKSDRYDAMAHAALDWLLARQVTSSSDQAVGLLRGGPDVSWISTQHNLVAWFAVSELAEAIDPKKDSVTLKGTKLTTAELQARQTRYAAAATAIAVGIDARLITRSGTTVNFIQGYGDTVKPLDVQTLGMLYLDTRDKDTDADRVAAYISSAYPLTGRSIALSTDAKTYNRTYKALGPFAGFRPYADTGSPDVIWAEGTRQARLAFDRVGALTLTLDLEILKWSLVTPNDGPLQADRIVTESAFNEYHVWPASAAASWTLLATEDPKRFLTP